MFRSKRSYLLLSKIGVVKLVHDTHRLQIRCNKFCKQLFTVNFDLQQDAHYRDCYYKFISLLKYIPREVSG